MADVAEQVRKLLALALNNPNEEEARSAVLMAVRLIESHNLMVGGVTVTQPVRNWTPPDPEFEEFWHNQVRTEDPNAFTSGGTGLKPATIDTDIDDDFMRKRITAAWRAIRAERARLKAEIHEWEVKYRQRYPRPDPAKWTE